MAPIPRLVVLVGLLFGLLAFVAPRAASAQSITIVQAQALPRLTPENKDVQKRIQNLNPEGVSLQDCRDDQRIRFPLLMTGFEVNASVEAWASVSGASCDAQTSRQGPTAVCWRLSTGIPLAQSQSVIIPVRDIMAGAGPGGVAQLDNGEGICGQVNLTTIVVQFLYFKPGQPAAPGTKAQIEIKVDTVGPPPVNIRRVLPGNGRIFVEWVSDGATTDGGTSGIANSSGVVEQAEVRVYCAPATAAAPTAQPVCEQADASDVDASDAGTEDAGCVEAADGGTTGTSSCASAAFETTTGEAIVPDAKFDAQYRCGNLIGPTGASVTAEAVAGAPLQNGTTYAVAVARTDGFANVGELSTVLCGTPEETNDFWATYEKAGGQGGCATTDGGVGGGAAAVAAFCALAMTRRRSRSRSAS